MMVRGRLLHLEYGRRFQAVFGQRSAGKVHLHLWHARIIHAGVFTLAGAALRVLLQA